MTEKKEFVEFEIQKRNHSPNAIIGIYSTQDKSSGETKYHKMLLVSVSPNLGKEQGDELIMLLRDLLEMNYIKFQVNQTIIQCPSCQHLQTHTYPKSGKLHCSGCGTLLEEIYTDEQ